MAENNLMAVTLTSDFKIDEVLMNTMFLNRLYDKTNIFNASSNDAFVTENQFVSGFAPKQSQIDETENLIKRMDITSTADVVAEKIVESQVGGAKVFRRVGPVELTQTAINERRLTEEGVYGFIAEMVAGQIIKSHRDTILKLLPVLLAKKASKYKQTKAAFKPTDVLEALKFYKEFPGMWALTLMSVENYADGLKQAYDDKIGNFSGMAVQNGMLYSLGRPVLNIEDSSLNIADADSTAGGAQPGSWVMFLPMNSMKINVTTQPRIVSDLITGKEQLLLRFQAEYAAIVSAKQHEWTGNDKNPTDAQLNAAASWEERAKSDVASIGFGLQVKDSA